MSRLGQVFLKNKHIQKKISDYVLSIESDTLVEIGPGSGAITSYIYEQAAEKLTMIEIDERLIGDLHNMFPLSKVILNDFLKVDFDYLDVNKKNILFGNIPYYITSSIIFKFLKDRPFNEAIFMVQREYAELLLAKAGDSRFSSVSALVQSFVVVSKVLEVGRNNFYPVPKVDSTVVHLKKIKNQDINLDSYSLFLRKCFAMPRKTLWNNLKKHFPKEVLLEVYKNLKIREQDRPEDIEGDTFINMFKILEKTSL